MYDERQGGAERESNMFEAWRGCGVLRQFIAIIANRQVSIDVLIDVLSSRVELICIVWLDEEIYPRADEGQIGSWVIMS